MKAFWISPKGKSIEVPATHIKSIIDNPSVYGLKKNDIVKAYDKYGEKVGIEGQARSDVMTSLMKKGWIRIRYVPRQDKWTIQTYYFGNREKNNTWDWLQNALKKGIANRYADINILIIKSGRVISSSFSEAAKGKKLFENLFKEEDNELNLRKIIEPTINESSLSRLWRHNIEHDCGAMTAFRTARSCGKGAPYTKEENKKRNKSLLAKIMSGGYSATRLVGAYPEGGKVTKESSFFIVDNKDKGTLLADLKKFGKEFEQDSILFVPKGTVLQTEAKKETQAYLYGTNSCPNNFIGYGKRMKFNKGKFGVTSKIYTSYVNGRPFVFEEVGEEILHPGNGMGVWAMHEAAKRDWTEL